MSLGKLANLTRTSVSVKTLFTSAVAVIIFFVIMAALTKLKTFSIFTSTSICRTNESGASYCRYKGEVPKMYINSEGLVLFYLDVPFDLENAKEKGYVIKNGGALALKIDNNDNSLLLLKFLEKAYENRDTVEIHARSTKDGFLVIDRVWKS
jgi:hypothetical protein